MARRKKKLPTEPVTVTIDSLSPEGRGVARVEGKTTFIEGALPGEEVRFVYDNMRAKFGEGHVVEVLKPSADRVEPKCEHAHICGGCSLQHMEPRAQIQHKQSILLDHFQHMAGVTPEEILPPLTGPLWGYRKKARLGVRYVRKKQRVLVGFREKGKSYLADLKQCEVLHPSVGYCLQDLSHLIASLDCYESIAQIEVAVDDSHTAMIFRNLVELNEQDKNTLIAFASSKQLDLYLQPKGPDSITLLYPEQSDLCYSVEPGLEVHFKPADFTQVNSEINIKMIKRAIELLELEESDQLLELFCGLGNFTLPLAKRVASVVGVEGDKSLIERANHNATLNNISNVSYHVANLMEDVAGMPWLKGNYNKILIDPPRSGAIDVLPHIAKLGAQRLLYISCNPATLARDAAYLVNETDYRLVKAGVMDMFPHTAHVESIALFTRNS
ncbi:MAG: 23S rRNA (uracil(1939)-C(5))-methyltransferase RlmD [Thioalkalispiraceae bacterium]|jgi:23S rRNA (uracil1939-C5)-methyltransferase